MKLKFIEHPLWEQAHPGEYLGHERCKQCAIAENSEGQRFLLWLSNGVHWTLSRNDPNYPADLGEIILDGI